MHGTQVLLVITGPPGSGKSTLARALALRLGHPLLAKDVVKEALFDRLGSADRDWSRRLSEASYEVMFRSAVPILDAGVSLIVEGNFRAAHAEPLRALIGERPLRVVQLVLYAGARCLLERFRARGEQGARHAGHRDLELLDELRGELERGSAVPLSIDGVRIPVDTTELATAVEATVEHVVSLLR